MKPHASLIGTLSYFATTATAKTCTNATVPVTISARQAVFDIEVPTTNLTTPDFFLNVTQQGRNFTDIALSGYQTTTGTYNISTMYCKPDADNSSNPTIQVCFLFSWVSSDILCIYQMGTYGNPRLTLHIGPDPRYRL